MIPRNLELLNCINYGLCQNHIMGIFSVIGEQMNILKALFILNGSIIKYSPLNYWIQSFNSKRFCCSNSEAGNAVKFDLASNIWWSIHAVEYCGYVKTPTYGWLPTWQIFLLGFFRVVTYPMRPTKKVFVVSRTRI